ncbi:WXG100 family type VII secretion target [Nocardia sp. NPDC005978]|uniref:WXG100 family type VII secretion target n=1 Tax=Nocardia sp. NPDC005978 TaxID=3156725 RepID=UPI0033B32F3D
MRHRVDLAQLDSFVTRVDGFGTFLEAQITELDRAVTTLQSGWEGSAADAQATAHAGLMTAAQEIRDGLKDIHSAAQAAHTRYTQAIAANVAMWRG